MSAPPPADPRPLILTARLDAGAQARFEALRRAHFPPERNIVPAHVSLFHQLPGSALADVTRHLARVAATQPVLHAAVQPPRSIGRGVAYDLHCPALVALHAALAAHWSGMIIAQDAGRLRPHVTVQNKVSGAVAAATRDALAASFAPHDVRITGLSLWRYLDGPWQHLSDHGFRG